MSTDNKTDIKMVIVMRNDLLCHKGKFCASAGHSSLVFLTKILQKNIDSSKPFYCLLNAKQIEWLFNGLQKKICLKVNSEAELLEIYNKAIENDIDAHLIEDHGLTEFKGVHTKTCVALGPDYSEKIDAITKHLKLF